jgi:hypothetical protein
VIFKTEVDGRTYNHLYFNEYCQNTPQEIVNKIEILFAEIAQMPFDNWRIRAAPQISRETDMETGKTLVNIFCRFSAEVVPPAEMPTLLGLGRAT